MLKLTSLCSHTHERAIMHRGKSDADQLLVIFLIKPLPQTCTKFPSVVFNRLWVRPPNLQINLMLYSSKHVTEVLRENL